MPLLLMKPIVLRNGKYSRQARGDTFRSSYKQLDDLRSIVPAGVRMMALTAMATTALRYDICHILGMSNPSIIEVSPNKPNTVYWEMFALFIFCE